MNISAVKGVGPALENKFRELGVFTVSDLICTLPKSYVDMDAAFSLEECNDGDFCAFFGDLIEISKPYKYNKVTVLHARAMCGKTEIRLKFYNQNYFAKTLEIGKKYAFYGKIKKEKEPVFINPKIDVIGGKKLVGIHPIYRTKGLIAQSVYSNVVKEAFSFFEAKSVISPELENDFGLAPYKEALYNLHFPKALPVSDYKNRVVIENVTKRICALKYIKKHTFNQKSFKKYQNIDFSPVLNKLPFCLSSSQQAAVEKLTSSLLSDKETNAILCGDVGSGKTIVAVLLCYFVIKNGYKTAFMAPTEILAKQHFSFIDKLFSPLGIRCAFLSGSTKKHDKEMFYNFAKNGKIDILVGTHSLLNESLILPDLGLIVTDEQHRFGVAQRTRLIEKGSEVAVLTMSATPIPRSLRLILYGEIDFLTIDRPRKSAIKTRIVTPSKREDMLAYVRSVCDAGQQAYIVAPRIFDNEGNESDSVETLYEELLAFFPEEWIGVVHGRLKGEEKQKVLDAFYKNEKKVLLSTTVIEVGIDVPNATVMVIFNAESFGLATLHQLRGRIGRGDKDGFCFLYTEKEPSEGLRTLVKCQSGFEIAEKDFELRGGGDIFGLDQSGAGSLDGLNVRVLKQASLIADRIDVDRIAPLLWNEINGFSLVDVSLN